MADSGHVRKMKRLPARISNIISTGLLVHQRRLHVTSVILQKTILTSSLNWKIWDTPLMC